jgi:hypothetical protein
MDRKRQALVESSDDQRRQVNLHPIQDGKKFKGVELASGVIKTIPHGLGHVPEGWIITKAESTTVYAVVNSVPWDKTVLSLLNHGATTVTVDIYVW